MELLSAAEMREADRFSIEEVGLPGPVLMENAGLRCVELVEREFGPPTGKDVVVCAGKGNNGGDGFVVARHLSLAGANVRVFVSTDWASISGDAEINLRTLREVGLILRTAMTDDDFAVLRSALHCADVAVDAVLGTGISGAPREPAASVIRLLNEAPCPVLSVDLPSGVDADTGEVPADAVHARWTVTFARPKIGLLLHPATVYCGELFVGSLGVPGSAFRRLNVRTRALTAPEVAPLLPGPRLPDTHKGTYGRVFVVGGSPGMSGAVVLACRAALRTGAGLVTAVVPDSLNPSVEAALIEATSLPCPTDDGAFSAASTGPVLDALSAADSVAVGPGLSRHPAAAEFARQLLAAASQPAVIDADGLPALAGHHDLLRQRSAPSVLTPHPGEAAVMLDARVADIQADRRAAVLRLAEETQAVVVLKGSRSLIATPAGDLRVNLTGNPGMATGGSGDVLTGMIATLLAQSGDPFAAASAGVYLHGLAGDLAAESIPPAGLVAGDLVDWIPHALLRTPVRAVEEAATHRLVRLF